MTTFGKWLATEMYAGEDSTKDIAAVCGVTPRCVESWLNEERYPRFQQTVRLADYFGIACIDVSRYWGKGIL
jgi:hypothetical protein